MYAKVEDNTVVKYPMTIPQIQSEHKNKSLPKRFQELEIGNTTYVKIQPTSRPSLGDGKYTSGTPVKEGNVWKQNWVKVDYTKDELFKILASHRYEIEVGGLELNGLTIQTNRESRTNILGAREKAVNDSAYKIVWKTVNGFIELDATTIISIADGVHDFIQKCFFTESLVYEKIQNNEVTNKNQVKEIFDTLMTE